MVVGDRVVVVVPDVDQVRLVAVPDHQVGQLLPLAEDGHRERLPGFEPDIFNQLAGVTLDLV